MARCQPSWPHSDRLLIRGPFQGCVLFLQFRAGMGLDHANVGNLSFQVGAKVAMAAAVLRVQAFVAGAVQ